MNIVLVEFSRHIREDVETECFIGMFDERYKLNQYGTVDNIEKIVKNLNADRLVLCFAALKACAKLNFEGTEVVYYGHDEQEIKDGASFGFKTIGVCEDSSQILEKLDSDAYDVKPEKADARNKNRSSVSGNERDESCKRQESKANARENDSSDRRETGRNDGSRKNREKNHGSSDERRSPRADKTSMSVEDDSDDIDYIDEIEEARSEPDSKAQEYGRKDRNRKEQTNSSHVPDPEEDLDDIDDMTEDTPTYGDNEYRDDASRKASRNSANREPSGNTGDAARSDKKTENRDRGVYDKNTGSVKRPDTERKSEDPSVKQKTERRQKERSALRSNENSKKKQPERDVIKEEFDRDLGRMDNKTKVVTVYSAKGGVGKTTIATELATYLSLVEYGRRKLKVCLVDYNIDFGDVRQTLNIKDDIHNLAYWAAEVRDLLEQGNKEKDIVYTEKEIDDYLLLYKQNGANLYVLQAPLTNEDSMGMEGTELRVILNNIVKNGNFDVVVCDTGNNTRDSSMIALDAADLILMLVNQNVNTANCDKSFMNTMAAIDFDLSKTKLIINSIMPQKLTALTVDAIDDFFDFDCIGKIKFNTDVIKAGNIGTPLAFQPDHEFTKAMRDVVAFILNDDSLKDSEGQSGEKKKKGIFAFLPFGRKQG